MSRPGGHSLRLRVCETTANIFSMMGAPLAWGRGFLPEEEGNGRGDSVVLSHALWDQAFGGDPRVLGQTVRISGIPFRVVGVAPAGFDYPRGAQLWTPTVFGTDRIPNEGLIFWQVLGRLKNGLPLQQASSLFQAEAARLAPARMKADEFNRPALQSIAVQAAGPARKSSLVLFAAVLCVLLIACGNVANLLLTRVLDRRKELLIRAALGASRARLFQQLLFESLALSLIAGVAGLLVAQAVSRLITTVLPGQAQAHLDLRLLAFAMGLSLLTGLVFGVLPAWHVSRLQSSNEVLRSGATLVPMARLRLALTAMQVTLTVVLLAGGVSLGRTFLAMIRTDPGYLTAGVATLRVSVSGTPRVDAEPRAAYYHTALRRLRALPGVKAAGGVNLLPLALEPIAMGPCWLEDRQNSVVAMGVRVTPGYFDALRTPLLAGHDFQETDTASSERVALVNEALARQHGGPQAVLGRSIRNLGTAPPRRIVGVAKSALHFGPGSQPLPQVFFPLTQSDPPSLTFVVRTQGPMAPVMAAARAVLADIDPRVPVFAVQPMDTYLAKRLASPTLYTGGLVFVGAFAGFLALLGLYANVAYSVSRRTREMAVRVALGSTPGLLRRLILRQSMLVVLAALALGTAVALAMGRILTALLYQAKPVAASDCVQASAGLALVATLAVLMAARRIGRLDPAQVLRSE